MKQAVLVAATAVAAALSVAPAAAQSTNATPVVKLTQTPFDPTQLPWVAQEARDYFAALKTEFETGANLGFVIAASPSGNWGARASYPAAPAVSLTDLARQALEACEYYYTAPCRIVAINNTSARLPDGGYSDQPAMLRGDGGRFDRREIPFVPEQDRANLRGYAAAASPKALALATDGWWAHNAAATEVEAITTALKTCEGEPKARTCFLYAVNDHVVANLLK